MVDREMLPRPAFFMTAPTIHVPVLMEPVLHGCGFGVPSSDAMASENVPLAADSNALPRSRLVVDGTLGGGGHALQLASHLSPRDTLVGIDRDPQAIERFIARLEREHGIGVTVDPAREPGEAWIGALPSGCRLHLMCGSYCDLSEFLASQPADSGMPRTADAILLDLGLSSDQLQDTERGFSFRTSGPLDLRFDPERGISAAELLKRRSEEDIANLIYQFGEERFSRRIARAIVERRRTQPIETSEELADLVHRCVPGRVHGRVDSATRTFQALRIAVNGELDHVQRAMELLPDCLSPGGRLVIISFHSLEDRIVKHSMRNDPRLRVLTKKPIEADDEEVRTNPRSRSAKLRIAERLASET